MHSRRGTPPREHYFRPPHDQKYRDGRNDKRGSSAPNPVSKKLFVGARKGGTVGAAQHNEVQNLFAQFGGMMGKRGPTFVFMDFRSEVDAQKALSLDRRPLTNGTILRVAFAEPDPPPHNVLYLRYLPEDLMAGDLRAQFSKFGELDHLDHIPQKNMAFVKYINLDDAVRAKEYFEGKYTISFYIPHWRENKEKEREREFIAWEERKRKDRDTKIVADVKLEGWEGEWEGRERMERARWEGRGSEELLRDRMEMENMERMRRDMDREQFELLTSKREWVERIERERVERERSRMERDRLERDRLDRERKERELLERQRIERERIAIERERELIQQNLLERERERERMERELEKERVEKELRVARERELRIELEREERRRDRDRYERERKERRKKREERDNKEKSDSESGVKRSKEEEGHKKRSRERKRHRSERDASPESSRHSSSHPSSPLRANSENNIAGEEGNGRRGGESDSDSGGKERAHVRSRSRSPSPVPSPKEGEGKEEREEERRRDEEDARASGDEHDEAKNEQRTIAVLRQALQDLSDLVQSAVRGREDDQITIRHLQQVVKRQDEDIKKLRVDVEDFREEIAKMSERNGIAIAQKSPISD